MKVAFLTEYFRPFAVGGAERSAETLARELARRGTRVTILTPNYGAPSREEFDGVQLRRLPFPQRLAPGELARRVWAGNPAVQLAHALVIARCIRRGGHALIHVQNSGMLLAGAAAARVAGVPFVVTVRDLAYIDRPDEPAPPDAPALTRTKWRLDHYWAAVERRGRCRALARASALVFVSAALRKLYLEQQVDGSRSVVLYNIGPEPDPAVDTQREAQLVLFVGKLSAGKGLHVLYAAAERLLVRVPETKFLLAGLPGVGFTPPPPAVAHMFSLVGRLENDDVRKLMKKATVVVAPAVWPEPLSRVLLEAMSVAAPIISSAIGGSVEALEHERSGLLVEPGDAEGLAEALERVLGDTTLRRRLGEGAVARLERVFSAAAIVPRVQALYERATSG